MRDQTGRQLANRTKLVGAYEAGDVLTVSVEGVAYEDYVIEVKGDWQLTSRHNYPPATTAITAAPPHRPTASKYQAQSLTPTRPAKWDAGTREFPTASQF